MINPVFKKSIFISLLGHLTVFSLLGFSFGRQLSSLSDARVAFWGGFLQPYELVSRSHAFRRQGIREAFVTPSSVPLPQQKIDNSYPLELGYLKPYATRALETKKAVFVKSLSENLLPPKKKESVVMFYPELPYHFNLYFKDRQVVHIELDYTVISKRANTVTLRRKISSGNLEADLLCMRHLEPYLSMQQDRIIPDRWHSVKIELEPKK